MLVTPRKDVPCVSQTKHWKGFFEAHFMSGEEINAKYPILNPLWKFIKIDTIVIYNVCYTNAYRAKFNDFHQRNVEYSDPWYRQIRYDGVVDHDKSETTYMTTVESNVVLLKFEKTQI